MFKKPPNIKPFAPIRSSDRKKLISQVLKEHKIKLPENEEEASEIKTALFPNNVHSARFITSGNESGALYTNGDTGEAIWFKVGELLLPTVSTLWRYSVLPVVCTREHVIEILQGGADLMLPGLVPPFPPGINKGSLVAIAVEGNQHASLAVGVADMDISSHETVVGKKGKAVMIYHFFGDEIWSMSKMQPPERPLNETKETETMEDEAVREKVSNLNVTEKRELDTADDQVELSTAEIDTAFRDALLFGLHKTMDTPHNLSYPITSSTLVSSFIQPFLPSHNPNYQLKKTSWKKAAKFLKAMEKDGILKVKDQKADALVTGINWESSLIRNFKPYKLPSKTSTNNLDKSKNDENATHRMRVVDFYKPSGKAVDIFEATGRDKSGFYQAAGVRTALLDYIEKENLVSNSDKRQIGLDPVLSHALFPSSSESNLKTSTREQLLDRLLRSCTQFYVILESGQEIGKQKPRKGSPPQLQILLETRQGRKTVTRISGLEPYGIDAQKLSEELRNTCASSTSVTPLQSSSPKNPMMEVLVQGPQTKAVVAALEERGMNKKWINVVDKTKK